MADTMKPYTAVCTREDDAWVIEVQDLPKVHTWAPDLRRAAEAIAVWIDIDPDQIDAELTVAAIVDREPGLWRAGNVARRERARAIPTAVCPTWPHCAGR